ncbi:MAG: hypothetical protein K1X94_26260 [Sandaracinaceae bacterium]|nr:hypothetical protein [Sandaracinaceae bacterium]
MRHAPLAVGISLALLTPPLALLSTGCKPPAAPGSAVGTFALAGTLEENTCGAGFSPTPSITFSAELRRSGPSAYWRMGDSGPRVQGTIDDDGDFHFRQTSQVEGWAADPVNGIPACRFTQTETIDGHVDMDADLDAGELEADGGSDGDAGASDAGPGATRAMSATNRIEIGVTPGFDCSLALVSTGAGGQFPSLPCHASYVLEGQSAP